MTARDPMVRLAEAMTLADEALRAAMHAIHDVRPGDDPPGDWYDRVGQLHAVTSRTKDLLDAVGERVGGLPAERLWATDGTRVAGRVGVAADELHNAAMAVARANGHVNTAWSQVGVLAVRDPEGGTP